MKKTILIAAISFLKLSAYSQNGTSYDTLKRNEISVSFLPALVLFSGYDPVGRYGSWNFSYKQYYKNRFVFRVSFGFAPAWNFNTNGQRYLKTQDTINIFSSSYTSIKKRAQINFGVEKIVRVKRFIHGFGLEFFLRQQTYSHRAPVYWYPTHIDPNGVYANSTYTPYKNNPFGRIYNGIDSLYYSYDRNDIGLGLHLFYTLRYQINSRFYLSSTMGPYGMIIVSAYSNQTGNQDRFRTGTDLLWDGHVFLVTDVSLAFRF